MMNNEQHKTPISAPVDSFQGRVQPWMMACFGAEISADGAERNHRLLEESLELVQACSCTASEAHQLVDYVYGRPVGERAQEVGGVMVTLAALCLAQGLDMHAAGETELARIWTKVEAIRAKQAAKPKHSPLPAAAHQVVADEQALHAAWEKYCEGVRLPLSDAFLFASGYRAALAAAPVQAQEPVAYMIVDDSGEAYFGEFCVASGKTDLEAELEGLNYGQDDEPYKIIPVYRAPVQPVAVPDGLRKAFVTLESCDARYSIVMKFNQKTDAFAAHDFLLGVGGKDYSSAAPAAQGDAETDMFLRGVIAALGALAPHCQHGDVIHDEIVRSVGKEALYRTAEPEDVVWAGLDPEFYAAIAAKAAS